MAGGRPALGKITISRRITPSLVPILDAFIKMLEENNGMVTFQPGVVDPVPQEVKIEKPIQRVGISPNEFLKSLGIGALIAEDVPSDLDKTKGFAETINHRIKPDTPTINIISKLHEEEKDYTAWQSDSLMQDIYTSCLWDASGENQCYPDGVEEYQRKYKDLWARLNEAKRNNKNQLCNEIMTEFYERIRKDE